MISIPSDRTRLTVHLLLLCVLLSMLGGCSLFRPKTRVDMAPFAENTVSLLADIRQGMDAQTSVYLQDYAVIPTVTDYRTHWKAYRRVLRGVAAYSLGIVTISKSSLTEPEQAQKLAEVLDEFLRPGIVSGEAMAFTSEEKLDAMLADVRVQKKFLDALRAAQPLVDAVSNFSQEYLDDMDDRLDKAHFALDERIKADHAASQNFYKTLIDTQNFIFEDLAILREFRQGRDPDAMNKLLERDPQLKAIVPEGTTPTLKETEAVQERLLYRLQRIREMTAQVQPDLDLYRQKMWELDELAKGANNNLTKTRATVIIWSRTHRGLAAGVTDPATFDVMGIAKRALTAAMPI